MSHVANNPTLTPVINAIHSRIVEGADIATPIKKSKVFPPMIGYMVSVGEQSGQLEDVLDRISESYEEELEHAIQRLTSFIEPVIILVLAGVVLFNIRPCRSASTSRGPDARAHPLSFRSRPRTRGTRKRPGGGVGRATGHIV